MNILSFLLILLSCLHFTLTPLLAAADSSSAAPPDVAEIQKTLAAMQQQMQASESQHQSELAALKTQLAEQQQLIDTLVKNQSPAPAQATPVEPLIPTMDDSILASQPATPTPAPVATGSFPTSDAAIVSNTPAGETGPMTIAGGGKTYLNISFDGVYTAAASSSKDLSHLEVGDHDPQQTGFNARNNELALDGAVDPYFEGFANIVFKLDNNDETSVEVEEAFAQTTSLPYGLQARAGQFFSAFGRLNPTHPHTWDFADAPLVNGRLLGSDGLRGIGVQLGWVAPLPWYSQFLLGVQNGEGNTGYSFRNPGDNGVFYGRTTVDRRLQSVGDLVFVPRWENSFDLSATQTVLFGVSGAFGPNNTGNNARTQIYGIDTFYKWKPANAEGGWPFLKWQSEAMLRRYEAGRGLDNSFPASETFNDWGAYSQLVWGIEKGWTTGLRYDYLHMDDSVITQDPDRQSRERVSADVTFYPSEFSKIRLQFNYDNLDSTHFLDAGSEESLFLQFEFALGAHGAHKF